MRLQDKIAINNMRLEGHSPSVIAATLGLPPGTVRSHIHRNPIIPGTKACKNCQSGLIKQPAYQNIQQQKFSNI